MRILILGPPNSSKAILAEGIRSRNPHLTITHPPPLELPYDLAFGALADYRTEIYLATQRAFQMLKEDHMIFTHNVVSSMAHVTARLYSRIEQQRKFDLNDEWTLALLTVGQIVNDSLAYDLVIRSIPPVSMEYYDDLVNEGLDALLRDLDIRPKILLDWEYTGQAERDTVLLDQIQYFIDEKTDQGANSTELNQQNQ